MSVQQERNLIVCLDIGTANISCVIGEVFENTDVEVLGVAVQPVKGMDRGGVNQLDAVINNLKLVIGQAEIQAKVEVKAANLSISGHHIRCQNEKGMVSIGGDEITKEDINYVIHTAKSIKIPTDRSVLHVLPQDFIVDELEGITDPLGMAAMRLEVNVHIITASSDWIRNIKKCVERCDIEVENIVFSGFASLQSVLTEDERTLGACVVDIGAGTTDLSIVTHSMMKYSHVLPIAGNQVTNDIAKIFCTPLSQAEELKMLSTCVFDEEATFEEIEVTSLGGRPRRTILKKDLCQVVQSRYLEIFEYIRKVIKEQGVMNDLASGIVLTGGAVKVKNLDKLAEQFFQMPVRIGSVKTVSQHFDSVNSSEFATVMGLLFYGAHVFIERKKEGVDKEGFKMLLAHMAGWFKKQF